ncbi:MAG: phosphatase PAP2 family protein [Bacteroidales bacterium]|nr:phosphatase PAP2 family protein [Bacteroidales bacterium]
MNLLRQLHHIDQDVTLAVNSLHCPATDFIWTVFSNKYIWFALYAAVLVFLYWRLGWKRATIVVIACVLTVTACDQLGNVVKAWVERLRPCWDLNMTGRGLHILEDKGNLYGFYSAHAANAMGFAICSWRGFRADRSLPYRKYGWFIIIWALLVGISRVFVGKHFLGDVLAGFAVGIFFGWLFSGIARMLITYWGLSRH